ncbi:hypothetical protein L195_g021054 [Trifolium pratense]|uniref:Uncharacterized protein n=1 Tax=Trifolium pratense TaxID=57577 RepID=A0A2K3N434_TRIPR|nr:hypothetical protein L195_g021054 [Trifolium pratense]
MDRVLLQKSSVEGGTQKHVEDDNVDLKSERKRVERGKGLKSQRKRVGRRKGLHAERERIRILDDEYKKSLGELGPFDAIIAPPPGLGGALMPLILTDAIRTLLVELSYIALEKYNDDNNQDPQFEPYEFDELIKPVSGEGLISRVRSSLVPSKPWMVESFGPGCLL